jgi:hypothetical protein
MSNE